MKRFIVISCFLAVVALALLAGCAGSVSSDPEPVIAEAEECFKCHTGDTTLGNNILGAKAQYANSGHYNGPRTLDPKYASTGHTWLFHGSNAMYTNGSPCSNCHTHQGFVEYVATNGTSVPNIGAASQPGCFTCHEPHETGNFILRTQKSVKLVDGVTYFDKGKGNLCATCHQARTTVKSGVTATDNTPASDLSDLTGILNTVSSTTTPKNFQRWSSSSGMHHGPQADFITGTNNWVYTKTLVTYQGVSKHYSTTSAPESCVTCHMFEPAGRLGGTLQLGGHGMYLTGDVHGSEKDIIDVCKTCHTNTGPGSNWPTRVTATTFEDSDHKVGDIDGDNIEDDILVEIDHMKKALLKYFGNSANFLNVTYKLSGIINQDKSGNYTGWTLAAATNGQAPITNLDGDDFDPDFDPDGPGPLVPSYEWNKDWEFNGFSPTAVDTDIKTILAYPAMNKWQSQSFWNFKYFMEDRSVGIHNPKYAAQILYDAIMNLYDNKVDKAAYGMEVPAPPAPPAHTSVSGLGTRPQ